MIPRAAFPEAGRTHRKIITKGLNYMASDPLQSTFREVPILDQALDVLLAYTAGDYAALLSMRDSWPYCDPEVTNPDDENNCENADSSQRCDVNLEEERDALLASGVLMDPILAILGAENQRTDCYKDTQVCVWFEAGNCGGTGTWGCISNECRFNFGEAVHATAFNHYFDDWNCYKIFNDKEEGRIIPFEGMGEHWEHNEHWYGTFDDIILRQGPIDWLMCDAGESRHAHLDYPLSLSLQNYVTETEWRDEHYDKCDPRWESKCWDHCTDSGTIGCASPCEEPRLCNWVNWGEYGMTSLNLRDIARFWVNRFTGEEPNLYFLGPVMHAIFDASNPQHAAGYNGNFHNLWETTISARLDEDDHSYGKFNDNRGLSSTCRDLYPGTDWTGCAVLWAGEYLRTIYEGDGTLVPGMGCWDLRGRIDRLMRIVRGEARREYDVITPKITKYFVSMADDRCKNTTDDGPTGADHADFDPENKYPYEFAWDADSDMAKCRSKPDGADWFTIYTPNPDENRDLMDYQGEDTPDLLTLRDEQFKEIDRLMAASLTAIYLVAQYFDCGGIDPDRDGFVADVCEGSPDQEDGDGDEIPDGCDLCPERDPWDFDQDRSTDWNTNPANDSDRDGVGNNCDSCPDDINPYQANCNKVYEDDRDLPNLGDACDPDPCPSLCSDLDPLAPEGRCTVDDYHSLVDLGPIMYDLVTISSPFKTFLHYDVASARRTEAEQLYWCSCRYFDDEERWMDDAECLDQCPERGERRYDTRNNTGWFEVVREGTMVIRPPTDPFLCQDDDEAICPCSMFPDNCQGLPPCSPTLEPRLADIMTCEFRGSIPKTAETFGPFDFDPLDPLKGGRNPLVQDSLRLDVRGINYPAGTPTSIPFGSYNRLKFWIRPLDRRTLRVYDQTENSYVPPVSERNPSGNQDWNNEYTPYQDIYPAFFLPIGSAHLGGLSDGHNMKKTHDWLESGGAPEAKDRIVVPDVWGYKIDGCPRGMEGLCFFDVIPPFSALLGITFIEFDAHSKVFWSIAPSRAAQGEVPGEKGMAMTMLRLPPPATGAGGLGEALIFAFGGENAVGVLSSSLWSAEKRTAGASGEAAYYWQRMDVQGEAPDARKDAAMFTDPTSTRVFLFGGINQNGLLGDLWSLEPAEGGGASPFMEGAAAPDASSWKWKMIEPWGSVPSARSGAVVAVDGTSAVFYGGTTAAGFSGEVFLFDPAKETFKRIEAADGPSLVREGADIEYDAARQTLYLYGGSSGAGLRNDLWKLDLRSKLWTQVLPECSSGTCPPLAADSLIVRDSVTGGITLLPGEVSASKQIYYVAEKYRWVGQAEVEGAPRASDCNGDGVAEESYGALCPTGSAWWAAPGKMVCDTLTEGLVCSSGAAQGADVGQINLPSATSFDVRGSLAWVTRANRLEGYDVSDPSHARLLSSLTLPGRARDVMLSEGYAFVASDRRVLVVDVRSPASPFVVSEVATCGQAKTIAVAGTTLAIAS